MHYFYPFDLSDESYEIEFGESNIPMVQTDDSTLADNYDHLDAYSAQIVGQRFYEAFKE